MSDNTIYRVELRLGRWPRRRTQGFAFDMLAWYLLYDDFGWDFEAIGKADRNELLAKMVYSAAKSANIHDGKAFRYTIQEVAGWIADTRTSEFERLRSVFEASMKMIPQEMAAKAEGMKDAKKKHRGMT